MSDYDALRKVINHEANQDDDGGFFAKLYGFQPEHDDEGPTARGLFQHWDAERDGPAPMPDFKRNSYVYRTSIPQHMWPKMPNIIALPDNPIIVTPIVTVRKIKNMWVFKCSHCPDYSVSPYWKLIYSAADYHAHNHHGR